MPKRFKYVRSYSGYYVPFWKKLNPLYWFDVQDSPEPPEKYLTQYPYWWRWIAWRRRNFAHGFFWTCIGVNDKARTVYTDSDSWDLFAPNPGPKRFLVKTRWLTLPGYTRWWDFGRKEWEFAIGWGPSGAFNLKLRRTIDRKNFDWEAPR